MDWAPTEPSHMSVEETLGRLLAEFPALVEEAPDDARPGRHFSCELRGIVGVTVSLDDLPIGPPHWLIRTPSPVDSRQQVVLLDCKAWYILPQLSKALTDLQPPGPIASAFMLMRTEFPQLLFRGYRDPVSTGRWIMLTEFAGMLYRLSAVMMPESGEKDARQIPAFKFEALLDRKDLDKQVMVLVNSFGERGVVQLHRRLLELCRSFIETDEPNEFDFDYQPSFADAPDENENENEPMRYDDLDSMEMTDC